LSRWLSDDGGWLISPARAVSIVALNAADPREKMFRTETRRVKRIRSGFHEMLSATFERDFTHTIARERGIAK